MSLDKDAAQSSSGENTGSGTVHVRVASLVTALFLGIAAIALAYIGGVMSGRHASQPNVVTESGLAQDAPTALEENGDRMGADILAAEELKFARVLRNEGNAPLEKIPQKAPAELKPPAIAAPAQTENSKSLVPEAENDKSSPPSAEKQASVEENTTPASEPASAEIFDYVFQMGAFRDEEAVDRLRQILEGHGLRTLMRRDGKVFLVLVRLRGDTARAAEISAIARKLSLGNPILRSRTPVKK